MGKTRKGASGPTFGGGPADEKMAVAFGTFCEAIRQRGGTENGDMAVAAVRTASSGRITLVSTNPDSEGGPAITGQLMLLLAALRKRCDSITDVADPAWLRFRKTVEDMTDQAYTQLVLAASHGAVDPEEVGRPWDDADWLLPIQGEGSGSN